jgi:hypothetical protein
MLGHTGAGYHLEFTQKRAHTAGRTPPEDNLLVFYISGKTEWQQAIQRLESLGYKSVQASNPYWDKQGKTFEDPDGNRVVFQNASWPE